MTVSGQHDSLDSVSIANCLTARVHTALKQLRVVSQLPSTNQALLDAPIAAGELWICFAEHQTAGRGRRGRQWLAPAGSGLCMSVGFGFEKPPADLSALTLVVGVVVAEELIAGGAKRVQLKWPNDLVCDGGKLGGILTESISTSSGSMIVVVGLGVNLDLPAEGLTLPDTKMAPAIDLQTILGKRVAQSELAGNLANAIGLVLLDFPRHGFKGFKDRFEALDGLSGRAVDVSCANGSIQGIATGVTEDGRLRLITDEGETTVLAGDVTVRSSP